MISVYLSHQEGRICLSKDSKEEGKEKPVFANEEEALKHVRSKSKKRHKEKKEDYESLIQGYEKAKNG